MFEHRFALQLLMSGMDVRDVCLRMSFVFGREYSEVMISQLRPPENKPFKHVFWGYGSMYSRDLSGDEISPGAYLFPRSVVPMKVGHKGRGSIGQVMHSREDRFGLIVSGCLGASPLHRGLSIGYRTKKYNKRPDGGRLLKSISVFHIAFVPTPMNPSCLAHFI